MTRPLEEVVKEALSEYVAYLLSINGKVPLSFGKIMQELRESLAEREEGVSREKDPDTIVVKNSIGSALISIQLIRD